MFSMFFFLFEDEILMKGYNRNKRKCHLAIFLAQYWSNFSGRQQWLVSLEDCASLMKFSVRFRQSENFCSEFNAL